MSEDMISLLDYFAKPVVKELKRIADTLEDLNVFLKAIGIKVLLQEEDKGENGVRDNLKDEVDLGSLTKTELTNRRELTDSKPLPVVKEVEPLKTKVVETKITTTEEVLMDPNEVTVIFKTDKSYLVTKKGFQKWIAFSLITNFASDRYKEGDYIEEIHIKEDKAAWFNEKKSWEPLKVRKR